MSTMQKKLLEQLKDKLEESRNEAQSKAKALE